MSKEIENAAANIIRQLIPSEEMIDQGIAVMAQLVSTMVDAQVASRISRAASHTALSQVIEAQTHMIAARRAMIRAHRGLAETGELVGLQTQAYGDTSDCPDALVIPRGHLAAVA